MRSRVAWLALAAILFSPGCSHHEKTTAPAAKLPPSVEAVEPVARAQRVWYDTEIWAQFKEPLDPATVTAATVFLKIDTRRISCRVSYDAATRRIRIVPAAALTLSETYTVELRPGLMTADGGTFDEVWFWQFTVFGLRRLEAPKPDSGATGQPPLATLGWGAARAARAASSTTCSPGTIPPPWPRAGIRRSRTPARAS